MVQNSNQDFKTPKPAIIKAIKIIFVRGMVFDFCPILAE